MPLQLQLSKQKKLMAWSNIFEQRINNMINVDRTTKSELGLVSNRTNNNVLLLQAPYNLRITFQSEILDATSQAAELLRSLGNDINDMKCRLHTSLLKRLHSSTGRLQRSIDLHSYLLTSAHNFYDCTAKATDKLCNTLSLNLRDCSGLFTKQSSDAEPNPNPAVPIQAELYHETMKKQQRKLYSWPSREVDEFEEDGGIDTDMIPRMRALESTAALSLATFTSLLIEFVARLDHLVDAIDALAKMAKFKQESAS